MGGHMPVSAFTGVHVAWQPLMWGKGDCCLTWPRRDQYPQGYLRPPWPALPPWPGTSVYWKWGYCCQRSPEPRWATTVSSGAGRAGPEWRAQLLLHVQTTPLAPLEQWWMLRHWVLLKPSPQQSVSCQPVWNMPFVVTSSASLTPFLVRVWLMVTLQASRVLSKTCCFISPKPECAPRIAGCWPAFAGSALQTMEASCLGDCS